MNAPHVPSAACFCAAQIFFFSVNFSRFLFNASLLFLPGFLPVVIEFFEAPSGKSLAR